jgi:glycosyltransferase involved in cell wall biosynthesis
MRRVLFLAHHFPPLGGGGVQRALKFARYLPELGYEPVVVTGPGRTFAEWTPADRSMLDEVPPELTVLRVEGPEPPPSAGRRRRLERVLGVQSPFDAWWAAGAVAAGRACGPVDLVFGELVPYTTAAPAAALARELGRPLVVDLQDPWALDEMWHYPTVLHRQADLRRMRRLFGAADAVVMNTPEAALRVRRRFPGLDGSVVTSVPNGFDAEDFAGPPVARSDGAFRIVHSGYFYTDLGLRHRRTARARRLLGGMPVAGVDFLSRSHVYLLEAVDRLLAADPGLASRLEIHLVGALSDTDRELASRSPVVQLHGYQPHAAAVELVRSADLLFLPMHDLPAGTRAGLVPGKTYEYLGAGRPILAAVPDGDARDLLIEAGNARVCRPRDVTGIAEAIAAELRARETGRPAAAPRADVVARYERRYQAAQLAAVFDGVLGGPAAAAAAA